MPLPDSTLLSLHVNANAVQSRPKRAMIVRMSAETLDALEAFPHHPPLSFDFGTVPGICIGDAFFPMRPQKESSPHELYLRAASAAKPMAPLKLYAHVVGKFMVERQLGDKVTDKVRQQTMVAKQQHMERQTILLDRIPAPAPKNAKRKLLGSGTIVKKTPPADPASRKLSPLPQNPPSTKASADLRLRLVRFLAVSPRLPDDVVKMVGGASIPESARQNILALLDQVAEQTPAVKGDKSPRTWQLKPQTWTEVRPFEWPKLSENERIEMGRQARMMFKALKIPETDPLWENARYRSTAQTIPPPPPMASSNSNRSSTSAHADTKRSGITKEAKSKSKHDASRPRGEIQIKDESAKAATSRVNAVKRAALERPPSPSDGSSGAKAAASRRLPGSGYQKKHSPGEKSTTPVDARAAPKQSLPASLPFKSSPTATPAGTSHARKTIPTVPPKPTKKEDESDREYERQKEREREKRERVKERQREEWERERLDAEKREKARQKEREAMEREKRQREKEREREEMELEKRQKEKEWVLKDRVTGGAVPSFQRKTAHITEDGPDETSSKAFPAPKRRKLDDGTSVASSTTRDAGLAGPKKAAHEPSLDPRLKMKKDRPSPQPSASNQERRATSSTSGSVHKSERPSKTNGIGKPRRRSPIYTSSEDEGEIPQPRKRNPSPPPVSDRSNSSDQPAPERTSRHHRTPRAAYPPANDHAALRALYQSHYTKYLGAFTKIVAQKRKIEAILNGDSDAEPDVMDLDDLMKLTTEHRSLKTELENIHDIYTKGTIPATASRGSASTSD